MTSLLLIAVLVLAALVHDMRKRLLRLEEEVRERRAWDAAHPPATPRETAPDYRPLPDSTEPAAVPEAAVPATESRPAPPPQPVSPWGEAETAIAEAAAPAAPEEVPATEGATVGRGSGFEELFGRKLPIWAGGITLLVAAVLLVRYSVEAGLLSPPVRTVLGFLFGLGLIGGAEFARRRADRVQDPRVAQALAGAGVGALYVATIAAANLHHLIGPGTAFLLLAAITVAAGMLALRFGAPCALLGLVGGLAAPALVQSDAPNIPLLAGYIAVLIGGLALLSRRQRWAWLGISALVGGAGWSLFMILAGALDSLSTLAVGLLVLLLGIGLPVVAASGRNEAVMRYAAAGVAAVQVALLVATGDFAPLTWGLYALLSVAIVWLAARMAAPRAYLLMPLFTALALAALWPRPDVAMFALVMAGIAAIYGGSALWRIGRDAAMADAVALAALGLAGYAVTRWQFAMADQTSAALALLFGAVPAAGAALAWARAHRPEGPPFALLVFAAALLLATAALVALPEWIAPVSLAAVAAITHVLARKAGNRWLSYGALSLQGGAVGALAVTGHVATEWARLVVATPQADAGQALLRWGAVAGSALGFAWPLSRAPLGRATQVAAALLGYGLVAQLVPAAWLAIAVAALLLVGTEAMRRDGAMPLEPGIATLVVITGLWAAAPLAQWLLAALLSLAAQPMLASALATPGVALRQLLVPAMLCGLALWRLRRPFGADVWTAAAGIAGVVALIGLHILYKQLFLIDSAERFVSRGLAERTLWEALLIGAGAALWIWRRERLTLPALLLIGAGLFHGLLYTIALQDPLWSRQAVGPLPVANLLLPAYVLLFAAIALIERIVPHHWPSPARAAEWLRMATILLLAFSTLRQLFAGSVIAGTPVGPVENIGWSILAIGIALGFLLWGIRRGFRDWRIASLVLMLAAVGKVFLLDAAGLEGLLRIVSFLALGFSLIGIGWLYSRYLRPGSGAA